MGEWTLLAARVSGHGADSDAPFEQAIWQAAQRRDAKIVSWATFDTQAEARQAAGIGQ